MGDIEQEEEIVLPSGIIKSVIASIIAVVILFGITIAAYRHANARPGTIILPGGITYLGPSATPAPTPIGQVEQFSADPTTPTNEWKGKKYPFTFDYPNTLSLGLFPEDPYDTVTVFWKDTNPNENLMLRVENLSEKEETKKLIGKPMKDYAAYWGKQYIWVDIDNFSEFTNSKGLKGLWVKFRDGSGNTSGDNYFYAVPNKPDLVIWMASRIIEPKTFDRIAGSVSWGK